MKEFLSVSDFAEKWNMSERGVRNYCSRGKIPGSYLQGKTWMIPIDAKKPERINKKKRKPETLLDRLKAEKNSHLSGGIYHKIQIDLTYNSNHIEGSRLTHDQIRYIFETNTIGLSDDAADIDDIIETANHFLCIDMIIDNANRELNEHFIKELHRTLKNGTGESRKSWFRVGEYKKLPNEVGGVETTKPKDVEKEIKRLLDEYNGKPEIFLDDILDFHYRFERIHPFRYGNGRIGRLIMFKECLKYNICPFIIDDRRKMFYYRGLHEWEKEKGYLRDTCLAMQDEFKAVLDYFEIPYEI
ncbi:MAG: Fic family protein [Clostridiales bacterium]|nr:Fic family protein [Clostridiales bacterium]